MGCASSAPEASAPAPPPPAPPPPPPAPGSFCTKCGQPQRPGAAFCVSCGHASGSSAGACPPASSEYKRSVTERRRTFGDTRKTRVLIDERLNEDAKVRRPCKYGLSCYRRKGEHVEQFSHPDDDDYWLALRKHGGKGEFATLHQCFQFMDPFGKGIIDQKELLGELLTVMEQGVSADLLDDIWNSLDDDGNGFASFTEFAEWAPDHHINLPLGVENENANGTGSVAMALECTFPGCECKRFTCRRDNERFCTCGHKRGLHAANDDESLAASFPRYWTTTAALTRSSSAKTVGGMSSNWQVCGDDIVSAIQTMVDNSVRRAWTRDRGRDSEGKQNPVPLGYEVVKVLRNENHKIWKKYVLKRGFIQKEITAAPPDAPAFEAYTVKAMSGGTPAFMADEPLDTNCNEWFLWHGTSMKGAHDICDTDFKQKFAGSATGTLYGNGTYFAESATKADEYAKLDEDENCYTMLLCRLVGGRVKYTDDADPNATELTEACLHGDYHSVLGDREKCRNTFREFVIYGSDQAYPEYIVQYQRKW